MISEACFHMFHVVACIFGDGEEAIPGDTPPSKGNVRSTHSFVDGFVDGMIAGHGMTENYLEMEMSWLIVEATRYNSGTSFGAGVVRRKRLYCSLN